MLDALRSAERNPAGRSDDEYLALATADGPALDAVAPLYLAGGARPGLTHRDNRAVHALARIMLHGRVSNIQTSWVKLGVERTQVMLNGGANDLGGTLMEETISRMAGSEFGSAQKCRRTDPDRRGHRQTCTPTVNGI